MSHMSFTDSPVKKVDQSGSTVSTRGQQKHVVKLKETGTTLAKTPPYLEVVHRAATSAALKSSDNSQIKLGTHQVFNMLTV